MLSQISKNIEIAIHQKDLYFAQKKLEDGWEIDTDDGDDVSNKNIVEIDGDETNDTDEDREVGNESSDKNDNRFNVDDEIYEEDDDVSEED